MMTKQRASMFNDNLDDFDPGAPAGERAPAADVRVIAERHDFRSRSPAKAPPAPRRHRTGRNIQLNVKVDAETRDMLYRLADAQGWVLGQTLQEALEALQEKLSKPAD